MFDLVVKTNRLNLCGNWIELNRACGDGFVFPQVILYTPVANLRHDDTEKIWWISRHFAFENWISPYEIQKASAKTELKLCSFRYAKYQLLKNSVAKVVAVSRSGSWWPKFWNLVKNWNVGEVWWEVNLVQKHDFRSVWELKIRQGPALRAIFKISAEQRLRFTSDVFWRHPWAWVLNFVF